ncbi:MAG: division/cell wall cluster transcriptional repressor MraZ [Candidatus Eisenbacteria bacterium]
MRRFLGTCYHTLDTKGRLSVPSKYRKDMGDRVVITRGHEGCLYVWPVDEWEKQAEELLALRQTASDPRDYMRNIAMNADEAKIDSHGRIAIAPFLRELAGLDKEVVIGGVINHLELWSPEKLEEYWKGRERTFEQTSERLYPTHIKTPEDGQDERS